MNMKVKQLTRAELEIIAKQLNEGTYKGRTPWDIIANSNGKYIVRPDRNWYKQFNK